MANYAANSIIIIIKGLEIVGLVSVTLRLIGRVIFNSNSIPLLRA